MTGINSLKVVLLHDWLTTFRGGERVLEAFCEIFPQASLTTLFHFPQSTSPTIENRSIQTSFLNSCPGIKKYYRHFLPFYPLAAQNLKIEDADLVLSSSHCVIKGVPKNSAFHISYLHSPMRYLYDQYDEYFGPKAPFLQKNLMKIFRPYLTKWDIQSNSNVDKMLANSQFVQKRIQKNYNRDSTIIHPFVDLKDFEHLWKNPPAKEDYYLMVTAFAPNKRVKLAVSAFNKLGKKLVIIGGGQQEKELKKMSKSNIQFLGFLPRKEIINYYSKAKAFIFPGVEDFGITPLEAMASGTPVIAFAQGGVLETCPPHLSQHFHENSEESLIDAIEKSSQRKFSYESLINQAQNFSKDIFKEKIQSEILRSIS